jgi:hypothetical protein
MGSAQFIEPVIGDWYRSHGQLFEVVATDDDERVIEIQHADGNLEELELDDWITRVRAGSLEAAEPPDNSDLATDHELEDEPTPELVHSTMEEMRGLRADSLQDLDLFE